MNYPEWISEPVRRYRICGCCPHHKRTDSFHTRIGPGSWDAYACLHPEAFDPLPQATVHAAAEVLDARHIGGTGRTPHWCRLIKGSNE